MQNHLFTIKNNNNLGVTSETCFSLSLLSRHKLGGCRGTTNSLTLKENVLFIYKHSVDGRILKNMFWMNLNYSTLHNPSCTTGPQSQVPLHSSKQNVSNLNGWPGSQSWVFQVITEYILWQLSVLAEHHPKFMKGCLFCKNYQQMALILKSLCSLYGWR